MVWLPDPYTERTPCVAIHRFPIHLKYVGKTIAICLGVAIAEADAHGLVPTARIRNKERHDNWQNPLLLAHQFKALVDDGMTKTEVAELVGVSKARVTQVMNLLKLHPRIQEYLSHAPDNPDAKLFSERSLRQLALVSDAAKQLYEFWRMLQVSG